MPTSAPPAVESTALAKNRLGIPAVLFCITNAGALDAYVSRGLGRPVGVGAALVAALAYNALLAMVWGRPGQLLHPPRRASRFDRSLGVPGRLRRRRRGRRRLRRLAAFGPPGRLPGHRPEGDTSP